MQTSYLLQETSSWFSQRWLSASFAFYTKFHLSKWKNVNTWRITFLLYNLTRHFLKISYSIWPDYVFNHRVIRITSGNITLQIIYCWLKNLERYCVTIAIFSHAISLTRSLCLIKLSSSIFNHQFILQVTWSTRSLAWWKFESSNVCSKACYTNTLDLCKQIQLKLYLMSSWCRIISS